MANDVRSIVGSEADRHELELAGRRRWPTRPSEALAVGRPTPLNVASTLIR